MPVQETSGYFTVGGRDLYGTYHPPTTQSARGGVLVLGPFGEERKCAYRLLVRLARACAACGFGVFRFDYSGTGEGLGAHKDASLDQWLDDAHGALEQARTALPCPPWYAVAARLGGNIATRLAARGGVAGVALVEPILSGKDYMRDLQRRKQIKEMMGGGKARTSEEQIEAAWESGNCVDFDGFEIGAGLADSLREIDLAADLTALAPSCSVQLLKVGAGKQFPPAWGAAKTAAEQSEGGETGIVRDKPFWGQIEYFESDAVQTEVLRFLQEASDRESSAPLNVLPAGDDRGTQAALRAGVELASGVCERAVRFGAEDQTRVGNLVLPDRKRDLGIVFVHGWSGVRGGPHGILTGTARRLAERGFPSLRFDLGGRGESKGNGMEACLPTMADDLVAATRVCRERAGVGRVVLFGMCSGGNVAIGTLPRLPDAAGLVLLSVYPFSDGDSFGRDMHRTLHFAKVYWHKLWQLHTWKRLFRGEVRVLRVLDVLFGHFRKRSKEGPARTKGPSETEPEVEEKSPPREHLQKLKSGIPGLMIYGSADPDAAAAQAYYRPFVDEHSLPIKFVEIDGAHHNFTSREWKDRIVRLTADFCNRLAD